MGPRAMKSVPAITLLMESERFGTRLQAAMALFRINGNSDAFERFVAKRFADKNGWGYDRISIVEAIIDLGDRGEVFQHHINSRLAWLIESHLDRLFYALERSNSESSIKLLKRISHSKNWIAKTNATILLDSITRSKKFRLLPGDKRFEIGTIRYHSVSSGIKRCLCWQKKNRQRTV